MDKKLQDLNILYLCKTMDFGGTEKIVLQLCQGLKNHLGNIVVCSCGGVHEKALEELGIKHYYIPNFDEKNMKNFLKSILKLRRVVKNEKINIIHSQHRYGTFLSLFVSKFVNVQIIHTAHNVFLDKKKYTFLGNNIIAVGENVRRNLVDYFNIEYEKIKVIHNGVEDKCLEVNNIAEVSKWKKENKFIVGNIGRICKQKGMEYFIRSIPLILEHTDNIRFVIVGDGELRESMEALAKELNVYESLIFLGYRNDIYNVINNLDLVVLSSLWEGLPLTPIEVFSQGKTIVATKVDGTPEIVKHYENGVLVEPKNYEEIAREIINLYYKPEVMKRLEKDARKTYLDKFTLQGMIDNYMEYYKEIAKKI